MSRGHAGQRAGGDRLPWVSEADNFAPLRVLAWQLHGFGDLAPPVTEAAAALGLAVHRFAWCGQAERAGFRQGASYLVRPDGYVALALDAPDGQQLTAYARRFGLRFGRPEQPATA